ncbi:MAG: hypothetical protein ACYCZ6_06355 [Polaromonas sp.]
MAKSESWHVPKTGKTFREGNGLECRHCSGLDDGTGHGLKVATMTYTNTNEKAAGASNTNGLHTDTNRVNFPTTEAIEQAPDGKTIATLIAQFALKGHVVHKTDGNDFLVTRWGLTRYCADFVSLVNFARIVGVRP